MSTDHCRVDSKIDVIDIVNFAYLLFLLLNFNITKNLRTAKQCRLYCSSKQSGKFMTSFFFKKNCFVFRRTQNNSVGGGKARKKGMRELDNLHFSVNYDGGSGSVSRSRGKGRGSRICL